MRLAREPQPRLLERARELPLTTPAAYLPLRWGLTYGLYEPPARLPAAIAGIAAVAAALLLLRDLFGSAPAVAAALLLAAAPLAVGASREALPATVSAATSLLAAWLLYAVLQGRRYAIASALGLALALACGWWALAVSIAGLIALAVGRVSGTVTAGSALRAFAAIAVATASFAPWAYYDLPTEQLAVAVDAPTNLGALGSLAQTFAFGAGSDLRQVGALVVALLALAGLATLRRKLSAFAFVVTLLLSAGAAFLVPRPPIQAPPAAPLLVTQAVYLGLATAGLQATLLVVGGGRITAPFAISVAAAASWWAAWNPPPAALSDERWRDAFAVVSANLGAQDRVAVPLGPDALEFYGLELKRRVPTSYRPATVVSWLEKSPESWLIARWTVRSFHWDLMLDFLQRRFVIDLSPTPSPSVLYLGTERRKTYRLACHFELPVEVLARQTLLRDCLREIGTEEGVLRQIDVLASQPGPSLRNPSLLESVTLLVRAGSLAEAEVLAKTVAAREPDWLPAQQALVAVRELAVKP